MKGQQPRLHWGRIRNRALCALCLLAMAFPSGIGAEAIELRFESSTPDPALEDLLYFAVGIELSQSGFSSIRGPGGALVLTTNYTPTETSVRLLMRLLKAPEDASASATVEANIPLSDAFEEVVGQTVRALFDQAPELAVPDPTGQGVSIAGVFPDPLPPEPPAPLPTTVSGFVETWVGGLGFFGRLAEVAQYGMGAGLGGGFSWLDDSWSLRVGARVSSTRALTNQGVLGGTLYLSAVALGAEWGTGRGLPLLLTAGGSAGVLVLTVAADAVRSKTVPWVDAVARMALPIPFGLVLGGELRFQVAFETNLILGVSPALSLAKEF